MFFIEKIKKKRKYILNIYGFINVTATAVSWSHPGL